MTCPVCNFALDHLPCWAGGAMQSHVMVCLLLPWVKDFLRAFGILMPALKPWRDFWAQVFTCASKFLSSLQFFWQVIGMGRQKSRSVLRRRLCFWGNEAREDWSQWFGIAATSPQLGFGGHWRGESVESKVGSRSPVCVEWTIPKPGDCAERACLIGWLVSGRLVLVHSLKILPHALCFLERRIASRSGATIFATSTSVCVSSEKRCPMCRSWHWQPQPLRRPSVECNNLAKSQAVAQFGSLCQLIMCKRRFLDARCVRKSNKVFVFDRIV